MQPMMPRWLRRSSSLNPLLNKGFLKEPRKGLFSFRGRMNNQNASWSPPPELWVSGPARAAAERRALTGKWATRRNGLMTRAAFTRAAAGASCLGLRQQNVLSV